MQRGMLVGLPDGCRTKRYRIIRFEDRPGQRSNKMSFLPGHLNQSPAAMLASFRIVAFICAVGVCGASADEPPRNWTGGFSPCEKHQEVRKRDYMNLGVRFSIADQRMIDAFARALDFWAAILEMDWHRDNSRNCSIHVVAGTPGLFRPGQVARAQLPDRAVYQGLVAINPRVVLNAEEQFQMAVHELGHMLGLQHNSNVSSVMYFLSFDGAVRLDATDFAALSMRHKLRSKGSQRLAEAPARSNTEGVTGRVDP